MNVAVRFIAVLTIGLFVAACEPSDRVDRPGRVDLSELVCTQLAAEDMTRERAEAIMVDATRHLDLDTLAIEERCGNVLEEIFR